VRLAMTAIVPSRAPLRALAARRGDLPGGESGGGAARR
jgi:hypothetical protein